MISFEDGPAAGQQMELTRAPIMLRVVCDAAGGGWAALSQLDDTPNDDETIHVYRLADRPTWVHLDGVNKETGRRFGKTVWVGRYRLLPDQPGDEHTRTNEAWAAWCVANRGQLLAGVTL